jgi:mannosyltransferase OCH1-like enzyme
LSLLPFERNPAVEARAPRFYPFVEHVLDRHADRVEAALAAAARDRNGREPALARRVWLFWEEGWEAAPEVVRLCLESWQRVNPDFSVSALAGTTVADVWGTVGWDVRRFPPRVRSDFLRLKLLTAEGGVWADATLFCCRPLDAWLPSLASGASLFLFTFGGRIDRPISSWFIAGDGRSPLLAGWCALYEAFLEETTRSGRLAHAYFSLHYLFEIARQLSPETREEWERLPKAQPAAGGVRKLVGLRDHPSVTDSEDADRHGHPLTDREQERVRRLLSSTPLQKLSWKGHAREPSVRVQSMLTILRDHIGERPPDATPPAVPERSRQLPSSFTRNAAVEAKFPAFYPFVERVLAEHRERIEASFVAAAERASRGAGDIPYRIWLFWDQGWRDAPEVVRLCRQSWEGLNPRYEVQGLDSRQTAELSKTVDLAGAGFSPRVKADLIRLKLVGEQGGVWADASLFCSRPLDAWLADAARGAPAFLFSHPRPVDRTIANWFLAGTGRSPLFAVWGALYESYLMQLAILGRRRHPYFAPHYLFDVAGQFALETREEAVRLPRVEGRASGLSRLVGLNSRRAHSEAYGRVVHDRPLTREEVELARRALADSNMQKLSWKGPSRDPTPRVRSMLGVLREYLADLDGREATE